VSDLVALARSPIAPAEPVGEHGGWEVSVRRSTAALTITDLTPLTKVAVRAPVDGAMQRALGVPFGRAARRAGELSDGELVVGSGPGEWLVLASVGKAAQVRSRLAATAAATGEFVSVVDLTHGRALVRLRGAASADLLAKVCAVDLSDAVTPKGAAFRSSVARLVTDVVRDDVDGTRSYLLHCERSSGQYLHDALLDAGAEFGIDAAGFSAAGFGDEGPE
jgi:heterotetrameric sarcosine oxidase gamma subunit